MKYLQYLRQTVQLLLNGVNSLLRWLFHYLKYDLLKAYIFTSIKRMNNLDYYTVILLNVTFTEWSNWFSVFQLWCTIICVIRRITIRRWNQQFIIVACIESKKIFWEMNKLFQQKHHNLHVKRRFQHHLEHQALCWESVVQ